MIEACKIERRKDYCLCRLSDLSFMKEAYHASEGQLSGTFSSENPAAILSLP